MVHGQCISFPINHKPSNILLMAVRPCSSIASGARFPVQDSSQLNLRRPDEHGLPLLPSGPDGVRPHSSHRAQLSTSFAGPTRLSPSPHSGINPAKAGCRSSPSQGSQGTATSPSSTAGKKTTARDPEWQGRWGMVNGFMVHGKAWLSTRQPSKPSTIFLLVCLRMAHA
jgi:hypothetical protein